jgi:hypothetical protein
LDCREYIEHYLSAHADGELSGTELRDAQAHVASCKSCAARLAQEHELKSLLRKNAAKVATPPAVREKILALLAEQTARSGEPPRGGQQTRPRPVSAIRRPAMWIPLAIAAGLAFAIVMVRGFGLLPHEKIVVVIHPGGTPEFDLAIANFERFNKHFEPNVPSSTYGDIAAAYVDAHMPGFIWNFGQSDLSLVGGRLDKLPDGRTVTYTFYKGERGAILCERYKVTDPNPPRGSVHSMADHQFYNYYGYSICYSYSPVGSFVCLLVTRQPVNRLLESVEYASE